MKKILVTGANGFVGNKLTKLLKKRNYEVISSDIKGEVDYQGSLLDSNFVKNLPDVDAIINCAAVQYISNNIPWIGRNRYFFQNNREALKNLRNRYDGSINFFIQFGSSMMYKKNKEGFYNEGCEFGNNGIYSKSKISAFDEYQKLNCDSAFIIPSIIGGYGRKGFFELLGRMIKRYNIVIMPGSCRNITSIVHVDDVCALTCTLLENKSKGIFNVASDDALSINAWVDLIAKKLEKKVFKIRIPLFIFQILGFLSAYRLIAKEQLVMLGHCHNLCLKKTKKLGWVPLKGIKDIIEDTF
ncbi:NAD(P)-dependent oxidoreductase [Gammaproteobacteria bacterium]|nr:NAD(P)-dependent oxidoreductase [Gammaproteobacteria bacterium]